MNQLKFYKLLVIILVLVNLSVIITFLVAAPKPEPSKSVNPRTEIFKILELDSSQEALLNKLADAHKQEMSRLNEEQLDILLKTFNSLAEEQEGFSRDSLMHQYHQLESAKVDFTYAHFQEIKEILREDQLPNFKEFMSYVSTILVKGRKKSVPPPQEKR